MINFDRESGKFFCSEDDYIKLIKNTFGPTASEKLFGKNNFLLEGPKIRKIEATFDYKIK